MTQKTDQWTQTLLGIIITMAVATISFLYVKVLPVMAENIIQNDKDSRLRDEELRRMSAQNSISIAEFRSMQTDISSIKEDVQEFKRMFQRQYNLKQ